MLFIRPITLSILFLLILLNTSYAQNLFINEFMASNSSTIRDPDYNAYADWIEIYNAESFSINLKNYFITDNLSNPQKYRIPTDLIVPSNGYTIIWADDMNTGNHTNFKLSASGESIGLYNSLAEFIDTITFEEQQPDVSEGRYPNGETEWYKFFPSSPGSTNLESNIYNRLSEPAISKAGGFYQSSVNLSISHNEPGVSLYYTIDGSTPTVNSTIYSNPITIDTTTTLTVKAFKNNFVPSKSIVNTYFINFETALPVFSIVTDPDNFFSDTSGIYVTGTNGITGNCSTVPRNWNQDWERPINMEFFERDKSLAFNVKTGVKINGGCSRIYAMKSLAFYFRGSYGYDKLNYRLFPDIPILSYNNFILRSSAQDWWRTMFRDGMVHTLIEQGMKIAYQEYRPSLMFLNGQYWGIHNIREKMNDHYLNSHYGVDISNIDLVEMSKGIFANNGDLSAYNSMINFLSTQNMALTQNYEYIKSIVDIDNYIDYLIAEIYSANADWPGSNMKLWRERTPSSKWRWLIYDLDFTFGGNAQGQYNSNTLALATATNGPDWPNPPWSTLMFRKMLENTEFKNEFIQRFAVHMNTTFEPVHVNAVIDSIGAVIASEIPRHKQRWPQSISLGSDWIVNVQVMKDFAYQRQPEVRNHFYSKFNLSGSYTLNISRNNPTWGKVYAHKVEIKKNNSVNTFFKNIPLKVRALPMPGYRFVRWQGVSTSTSPEIEIINSSNSYLTAIFEPAELTITTLVINEINYKSSPSFDTEDWIELYNPIESVVDLSGWKIRDSSPSNSFTFPAGSRISGNGHVVICRDTLKFKSLHLNVENVYGNLGFGISSDGDLIMLFDSYGNLVDSVFFESSGEWTSLPNGNGPTLSLINPQSDNTLPLNWKASGLYGTPGRLNDTYTKVEHEENTLPENFYLFQNYPNPFNPATKIRFIIPALTPSLSRGERVTLKVYDIIGNAIATLVDEEKEAGSYEVEFSARGGQESGNWNLASGIYFYQLKSGNFLESKKMILLR